MIVRKFSDADLEQVVALADAAWVEIRKMSRRALGEAISDVLRPGGDAGSKGKEVRAQLAAGSGWEALVAEEEGRIVGFVTFAVMGGIGCIGNNASSRASGIKGIGQAMYRKVLDIFRARGVRGVRVTTGLDDAHAAARRAYERAGFSRHLDSRTYYLDLEEMKEKEQ